MEKLEGIGSGVGGETFGCFVLRVARFLENLECSRSFARSVEAFFGVPGFPRNPVTSGKPNKNWPLAA